MLTPKHTKKFEKDVARCVKRGKPMEELKTVANQLLSEKPLAPKYRDHKLKGDYVDCRECHIEPDWLLVYRKTKTHIIFEGTGTHSDLF